MKFYLHGAYVRRALKTPSFLMHNVSQNLELSSMKKVTFITVQAPWTHTYLQQDLVGVPNEAFEGQISECVSYLNFYRADL
jgi:hypothetical protein